MKNLFIKSIFNSSKFSSNLLTNNLIKCNKHFCTFSSPMNNKNDNLPIVNLNTIRDNPGARPKNFVKGRGNASGKGKTAGKGHKGTQRNYTNPGHVQGGQRPLHRISPKFGQGRFTKYEFSELNITRLHYLITKERLDVNSEITLQNLIQVGAVSKVKNGIKLLGKGLELLDTLPPLNISVSSASESVINKINEMGGKITCEYHSPLKIRQIAKPYKFIRLSKEAVPRYRSLIYYMKLKEMGAQVVFLKPIWMKSGEYDKMKKNIQRLRDALDEQPDAHLLPVYPADRSAGPA